MKKRRGNSRFFIIFVSVLSGVYLLYLLLAYLNNHYNFFPVRVITFSGNSTIRNSSLETYVDSLYNKNLYSLNKKEILAKFAAIPRLAGLKIKRQFPDELQLLITERIPVFMIKTREGLFLPVDENAYVLNPPENGQKEELPFISLQIPAKNITAGEMVNDDFLDFMLAKRREILQFAPDFFEYVSEIYFDKDKPVFVEADQGYRVVFDLPEMGIAVKEFMKIKDTFSFDSNTMIDMRQDGFYRIKKMEKK